MSRLVSSPSSWTLNDDVSLVVFSYLDAYSLATISRVCKHFHRLGHDAVLWSQLEVHVPWIVGGKELLTLTRTHPVIRTLLLGSGHVFPFRISGSYFDPRPIGEAVLQAVSHLKYLTALDCSHRDLRDAPDFVERLVSFCPNLTALNLSQAKILDTTSFARLAGRIAHLDLNGCEGVGRIADAYSEKLRAIDLRCVNSQGFGSRVSDGLDLFKSKPSFDTLGFSGSLVTEVNWEELGRVCRDTLTSFAVSWSGALSTLELTPFGAQVRALTYVEMRAVNRVADEGIAALVVNCPNLKSLHVINCANVNGSFLENVCVSCPVLEVLSVGFINLEERFLASLRHVPIKAIRLGPTFSGRTPPVGNAALASLAPCKLECFYGQCINVSWEGLELVDWSCLTNLKLSRVSTINDKGLAVIGSQCRNLKAVVLRDIPHATCAGVTSLIENKRVRVLSLNAIAFVDPSDDSSGGLNNMRPHCEHLQVLSLVGSRCTAPALLSFLEGLSLHSLCIEDGLRQSPGIRSYFDAHPRLVFSNPFLSSFALPFLV